MLRYVIQGILKKEFKVFSPFSRFSVFGLNRIVLCTAHMLISRIAQFP